MAPCNAGVVARFTIRSNSDQTQPSVGEAPDFIGVCWCNPTECWWDSRITNDVLYQLSYSGVLSLPGTTKGARRGFSTVAQPWVAPIFQPGGLGASVPSTTSAISAAVGVAEPTISGSSSVPVALGPVPSGGSRQLRVSKPWQFSQIGPHWA